MSPGHWPHLLSGGVGALLVLWFKLLPMVALGVYFLLLSGVMNGPGRDYNVVDR